MSLESRIEALERAVASRLPSEAGPEQLLHRLEAELLTPDELVRFLFPLVEAELRASLYMWLIVKGPVEDPRDCGFWPVGVLGVAPFLLRCPPGRELEPSWASDLQDGPAWRDKLNYALAMDEGQQRSSWYRRAIADGLAHTVMGDDPRAVSLRRMLHSRDELPATGPWSAGEMQLPSVEQRRFNARLHEFLFGPPEALCPVPIARGQPGSRGPWARCFMRGSLLICSWTAWACDPADAKRLSHVEDETIADIPVQDSFGMAQCLSRQLGVR